MNGIRSYLLDRFDIWIRWKGNVQKEKETVTMARTNPTLCVLIAAPAHIPFARTVTSAEHHIPFAQTGSSAECSTPLAPTGTGTEHYSEFDSMETPPIGTLHCKSHVTRRRPRWTSNVWDKPRYIPRRKESFETWSEHHPHGPEWYTQDTFC